MKKYKEKEWLTEKYHSEMLSASAISKEAGCCKQTILKWLHNLQIPVRTDSEAMRLVKRRVKHVQLCGYLLEFLEGELLGDGSVHIPKQRTGRYTHSSSRREYLVWLSGELSAWGLKGGAVYKTVGKSWGKEYPTWHYQSNQYAELADLRKRFYPAGKKIVPNDLILTPIIARQWFIGDGCLRHPPHTKRERPYIEFCTDCFNKHDRDFLSNQLCSKGFKAFSRASGRIRISTFSTQDFLKWIGPCPEQIRGVYGYKWQYDTSPLAPILVGAGGVTSRP